MTPNRSFNRVNSRWWSTVSNAAERSKRPPRSDNNSPPRYQLTTHHLSTHSLCPVTESYSSQGGVIVESKCCEIYRWLYTQVSMVRRPYRYEPAGPCTAWLAVDMGYGSHLHAGGSVERLRTSHGQPVAQPRHARTRWGTRKGSRQSVNCCNSLNNE